MKAIPLSRRDLMRGGGEDVLGMSKDNALDFHMAAKTEIAFLAGRIAEEGALIAELCKTGKQNSQGAISARNRRWELKLRKLSVTHEMERSGSFHAQYYKRAMKMLDKDTHERIRGMASVDAREIERATVVE